MHIDLHSLLIRPLGVGPNAFNGAATATTLATKRLQPTVERALEVQLGGRQRDLTYGPAGLFAPASANAAREAAAASGADRDDETAVDDAAEASNGNAGAVQRVAAPRDETAADRGAAAEPEAQDEAEGDAGVAERALAGAAEEAAEEAAEAEAATEGATEAGEDVAVDGSEPAPEESSEVAAADEDPALDETESPIDWGAAYAEDAAVVDALADAEPVTGPETEAAADPVADPVAEAEAAVDVEAEAEPVAVTDEVTEEVAEPAAEAAAEGIADEAVEDTAPTTSPAWAAMADQYAQAEAGDESAPMLDLVA